MTGERVVILGGGLAAQRCAETLRRSGHEGEIVIVCGERHRPYDRPPLSKDVLLDAGAEETLCLRPSAWYEEKAVQLRLGVAARLLNHRERRVELSDGSSLPYARLLIATGARPRRLGVFERFENVSTLRTLEDASWLRAALVPNARLLIIGAGFIGQEAASAARRAGAHATIVEADSAPLVGALGAELGAWFTDLNRSNGVELLLEDRVAAVSGARRVDGVTLASGRTLQCDHVLLGVGVQPNLDWLGGGPLQRTGVRTDVDGRSEIPDVYAAGDAAASFDPLLEAHVLGSHWETAARQGARVAKSMLGLDPGPPSVSSFWSDLYGTRVQYLGRASVGDELSLDGDPDARDFTATFTRQERPVAVLLAGRPQMLPRARAMLTATAAGAYA
jgi:3-phenylpropionate/trans-cinnamate dioxygenase ferredoxin reductase subunit